jgi:hypothetical protein
MSARALPHLLQRARRAWQLASLRSRVTQLADCIDGLEMQIHQESADLRDMQAEHSRISALLAQAEQPLPAFARTGWGQP